MKKLVFIFCVSILLSLAGSRDNSQPVSYPTPTTIIISPISPISPVSFVYLPMVIR